MYNSVEVWFRHKPTAKNYFKKLSLGKALMNWLITLRGKYSHVELVIDNYAYSAILDKGVRRTEVVRLNRYEYDVVEVRDVDLEYITEFYLRTKGHKYDILGILLSQMFPINRHCPNKWFCSEWVMNALGYSKTQMHGVNLAYSLLSDRSRHGIRPKALS
jgi:hypothetical protein